jgi:type IV pilus assembly protein PilC
VTQFNYEGYSTSGKLQKGKVRASSLDDARTEVKGLGITATKVNKNQDIALPWNNRNPSLKDRAMFTQQFAQLIGGGVPQRLALGIAARTITNERLRTAVEKVRVAAEAGEALDDVFARQEFSTIFDPVFVAFIRMGREAGGLAKPLMELAEMYRWQLKIQGMVKKGLMLPGIIGALCLVVTYFIMAKVVPTFMKILDQLNTPLPPLTAAVKALSDLLSNPYFTVGLLLGLGSLIYGGMQYRKTPRGKLQFDRLMLRLPVVGPLLKTFTLARYSKAVAVMLKNRIPLQDTLTIGSGIASNEVYRALVLEMRAQVIIGEPMWHIMQEHPKAFPELYWSQYRVAEEQQSLPDTLAYLGALYDDEVDSTVEGLTTAIEPFLIMFLGGVVGVIVVSVFLPMATMIGSLSK